MNDTGVTLLELLIVFAILTVLTVAGSSSFYHISVQLIHRAQADLLLDFIQQSRQSAIQLQRDVYVTVNTDAYCLGASHSPLCDCSVANACTIDGEPQIANIDRSTLNLEQTKFANQQQYKFEHDLGTAVGYNGSFVLRSVAAESKVVVSALGRIRQCVLKGHLSGVASC